MAVVDVQAAVTAAPRASRNLAVQVLMARIWPWIEPWLFRSHRVIRIYPLYLFLVATWAVIGRATGAQKVGFHLLTLTLAPVGNRPVFLGPEWTLIYECSYCVAAFALAPADLQKHLVPVACAWLVAIAAAQRIPEWDAEGFFPVGPTILLKVPSVAFAGELLVPALARRAPIGLRLEHQRNYPSEHI